MQIRLICNLSLLILDDIAQEGGFFVQFWKQTQLSSTFCSSFNFTITVSFNKRKVEWLDHRFSMYWIKSHQMPWCSYPILFTTCMIYRLKLSDSNRHYYSLINFLKQSSTLRPLGLPVQPNFFHW